MPRKCTVLSRKEPLPSSNSFELEPLALLRRSQGPPGLAFFSRSFHSLLLPFFLRSCLPQTFLESPRRLFRQVCRMVDGSRLRSFRSLAVFHSPARLRAALVRLFGSVGIPSQEYQYSLTLPTKLIDCVVRDTFFRSQIKIRVLYNFYEVRRYHISIDV